MKRAADASLARARVARSPRAAAADDRRAEHARSGCDRQPDAGTAPATPTPAQPARPNVIVVGPDGNVKSVEPRPPTAAAVATTCRTPTAAATSSTRRRRSCTPGRRPTSTSCARGDTLWDICFFYFNDPWQWPKIWSYNPQITNPHWIYPGDLVRLLPRGVFAAATRTRCTEPEPDPKQPDPVPAPAKRVDVRSSRLAFVEKADLDKLDHRSTAPSTRRSCSAIGDSVYLSYPTNKPPKVGKRYSIYEPGRHREGGRQGCRRVRAGARHARGPERQAGQARARRDHRGEPGDRARREGRPARQAVQERAAGRAQGRRAGPIVAMLTQRSADRAMARSCSSISARAVGRRGRQPHVRRPPRRRATGADRTTRSARTTAGSRRARSARSWSSRSVTRSRSAS